MQASNLAQNLTRRFRSKVINLHFFNDALQRFEAANSIEEITGLCASHCRQLGFDFFVYALRIPSQFAEARVIMLKGYPDAWLDHYWENGYATDDPAVIYCSQNIIPIEWHALAYGPRSKNASVMHNAADFGLKAGISMPVHSPHGELGILSFALNRNDAPAREITRHAMPFVQMLAVHVHEALRRVLISTDLERPQELTAREAECLRWAADGKTSWEIAQLLKMSERTVNFHLNNAMIKLDVCNRQHAIARAILHGMINPHPF